MKTVNLLLPDNLHDQLQRKAKAAGFDLPAYMLALLSEAAAPKPDSSPIQSSSEAIDGASAASKTERSLPTNPIVHEPGGTKGPQSNMSVVIRWDLIGKGQPEKIWLNTAAATLVETLHRLWKGLGEETLAKLASFRVSRGPLLSSNPERDFVNRVSGELYSHQQLPKTRLYVRTHSSTEEKCKELSELLTHLRQPQKLLEIKQHRKH